MCKSRHFAEHSSTLECSRTHKQLTTDALPISTQRNALLHAHVYKNTDPTAMVVYNGIIYMALDMAPVDAHVGTWTNDCQTTATVPMGNWSVGAIGFAL